MCRVNRIFWFRSLSFSLTAWKFIHRVHLIEKSAFYRIQLSQSNISEANMNEHPQICVCLSFIHVASISKLIIDACSIKLFTTSVKSILNLIQQQCSPSNVLITCEVEYDHMLWRITWIHFLALTHYNDYKYKLLSSNARFHNDIKDILNICYTFFLMS